MNNTPRVEAVVGPGRDLDPATDFYKLAGTCDACAKPERSRGLPSLLKVACPICGKKVKPNGLADHQRDVHKRIEGRNV